MSRLLPTAVAAAGALRHGKKRRAALKRLRPRVMPHLMAEDYGRTLAVVWREAPFRPPPRVNPLEDLGRLRGWPEVPSLDGRSRWMRRLLGALKLGGLP